MLHRLRALALLAALGLLLASPPFAPLRAAEPERRAPSADAPPHTVFTWTTTGNPGEEGLRFAWCIPPGYDGKTPRHLTVILHGTGLDYRWGFANHRAGRFRPRDIVVSVDGTSPGSGGSRLFLGKPKDANAFQAFLDAMHASFAVDRVYLYGHSQGGFFAVYFAGEHPESVAGVVAHASGAWNWSKTGKAVHRVAICFQHGTKDPVVPYAQSVGSRDYYVKAGFPFVHLRRLPGYNHWPNEVRTGESLAWCEGMTTPVPAEALADVHELLRPKPKDGYGYATAVDYAGARMVLRRFQRGGPAPLAVKSKKLLAEARALTQRVEKEGARHVRALSRFLRKPADLRIDGRPWLGHVRSVREDFRGVDTVEAFLKAIDYDDAVAVHRKKAAALARAWRKSGDDATRYRAVIELLPQCFLADDLPSDIPEKMKEWRDNAAKLGLKRKEVAAYALVEMWQKGLRDGIAAYDSLWKRWK